MGPLARPEEIRAYDIGKMRVGKTFDIAAPRFHENLGVQGQRIPVSSEAGGACPAVISFIQDPINDCVIAFSLPTKFFESISCFRL